MFGEKKLVLKKEIHIDISNTNREGNKYGTK